MQIEHDEITDSDEQIPVVYCFMPILGPLVALARAAGVKRNTPEICERKRMLKGMTDGNIQQAKEALEQTCNEGEDGATYIQSLERDGHTATRVTTFAVPE